MSGRKHRHPASAVLVMQAVEIAYNYKKETKKKWKAIFNSSNAERELQGWKRDEHYPQLDKFVKFLDVFGYTLQIVKKENK